MNAYEKRQKENAKYGMCNAENVAAWKDELNALHTALATVNASKTPESPMPLFARDIRSNFQTFCAYQQFIHVDALDKKDYPNGIDLNSIYFEVEVDLIDKTFRIHSCGRVWLCRQEQKDTNLAMASMKNIVLANKGKWGRSTKYKDAKDFAKKLAKLWEDAMTIINGQTDGYPYKQLREDANRVYAPKREVKFA